MDIDLTLLHSRNIPRIDITGTYSIPKDYFTDYPDILAIDNIAVVGSISLTEEDLDYLSCTISGNVTLADSISLEPVKYEINSEIKDILTENCKKSSNTLDIFSILWENIVLEIPLQFTKVEDLSKFHGDGWKLISEEDATNNNNPFRDLLDNYNKEE